MNEIWVPAKCYTKYWVSNFGRVSNIDNMIRSGEDISFSFCNKPSNYRNSKELSVTLFSDTGTAVRVNIKWLVYNSFYGTDFCPGEIIHRDGDYKNNHLNNLTHLFTQQSIEVWKDVLGYEGSYQVSNFGRVRSLPHVSSVDITRRNSDVITNEQWNRNGLILQYINVCEHKPSLHVRLYTDSKHRTSVSVKGLVYNTFHETNYRSSGLFFIDEDPCNLHLSNITPYSLYCVETGEKFTNIKEISDKFGISERVSAKHIHQGTQISGMTIKWFDYVFSQTPAKSCLCAKSDPVESEYVFC